MTTVNKKRKEYEIPVHQRKRAKFVHFRKKGPNISTPLSTPLATARREIEKIFELATQNEKNTTPNVEDISSQPEENLEKKLESLYSELDSIREQRLVSLKELSESHLQMQRCAVLAFVPDIAAPGNESSFFDMLLKEIHLQRGHAMSKCAKFLNFDSTIDSMEGSISDIKLQMAMKELEDEKRRLAELEKKRVSPVKLYPVVPPLDILDDYTEESEHVRKSVRGFGESLESDRTTPLRYPILDQHSDTQKSNRKEKEKAENEAPFENILQEGTLPQEEERNYRYRNLMSSEKTALQVQKLETYLLGNFKQDWKSAIEKIKTSLLSKLKVEQPTVTPTKSTLPDEGLNKMDTPIDTFPTTRTEDEESIESINETVEDKKSDTEKETEKSADEQKIDEMTIEEELKAAEEREAERLRQEHEKRINKAATILQKMFRGYLARKIFTDFKKSRRTWFLRAYLRRWHTLTLAFKFNYKRLIRAGVNAFINNFNQSFAIEKKVTDAIQKFYTKRIMYLCFQLWYRFMKFNKSMRIFGKYTEFHYRIPQWDMYVKHFMHKRKLNSRAKRFNILKLKEKAMKSWKYFTRTMKARKKFLHSIDQMYNQKLGRKVLLSWRDYVIYMKIHRKEFIRIKRTVFLQWKLLARLERSRNQFLTSINQKRKKWYFDKWIKEQKKSVLLTNTQMVNIVAHKRHALLAYFVIAKDDDQVKLILMFRRWKEYWLRRKLFLIYVSEVWKQRSLNLKRYYFSILRNHKKPKDRDTLDYVEIEPCIEHFQKLKTEFYNYYNSRQTTSKVKPNSRFSEGMQLLKDYFLDWKKFNDVYLFKCVFALISNSRRLEKIEQSLPTETVTEVDQTLDEEKPSVEVYRSGRKRKLEQAKEILHTFTNLKGEKATTDDGIAALLEYLSVNIKHNRFIMLKKIPRDKEIILKFYAKMAAMNLAAVSKSFTASPSWEEPKLPMSFESWNKPKKARTPNVVRRRRATTSGSYSLAPELIISKSKQFEKDRSRSRFSLISRSSKGSAIGAIGNIWENIKTDNEKPEELSLDQIHVTEAEDKNQLDVMESEEKNQLDVIEPEVKKVPPIIKIDSGTVQIVTRVDPSVAEEKKSQTEQTKLDHTSLNDETVIDETNKLTTELDKSLTDDEIDSHEKALENKNKALNQYIEKLKDTPNDSIPLKERVSIKGMPVKLATKANEKEDMPPPALDRPSAVDDAYCWLTEKDDIREQKEEKRYEVKFPKKSPPFRETPKQSIKNLYEESVKFDAKFYNFFEEFNWNRTISPYSHSFGPFMKPLMQRRFVYDPEELDEIKRDVARFKQERMRAQRLKPQIPEHDMSFREAVIALGRQIKVDEKNRKSSLQIKNMNNGYVVVKMANHKSKVSTGLSESSRKALAGISKLGIYERHLLLKQIEREKLMAKVNKDREYWTTKQLYGELSNQEKQSQWAAEATKLLNTNVPPANEVLQKPKREREFIEPEIKGINALEAILNFKNTNIQKLSLDGARELEKIREKIVPLVLEMYEREKAKSQLLDDTADEAFERSLEKELEIMKLKLSDIAKFVSGPKSARFRDEKAKKTKIDVHITPRLPYILDFDEKPPHSAKSRKSIHSECKSENNKGIEVHTSNADIWIRQSSGRPISALSTPKTPTLLNYKPFFSQYHKHLRKLDQLREKNWELWIYKIKLQLYHADTDVSQKAKQIIKEKWRELVQKREKLEQILSNAERHVQKLISADLTQLVKEVQLEDWENVSYECSKLISQTDDQLSNLQELWNTIQKSITPPLEIKKETKSTPQIQEVAKKQLKKPHTKQPISKKSTKRPPATRSPQLKKHKRSHFDSKEHISRWALDSARSAGMQHLHVEDVTDFETQSRTSVPTSAGGEAKAPTFNIHSNEGIKLLERPPSRLRERLEQDINKGKYFDSLIEENGIKQLHDCK